MDTTIFEAPQSAETPKATYAATADCARISSLKNYQTEKGEFAGILRATMACPETEKVMDGRYGYSFFSDFGDGLGINYGEDGTMIDVFGRTAQRMGPDDWSELILAVREVGARFTKLTLTLVDVSHVFQTEEMAGKIQNREFVTRLRNLSMVRPSVRRLVLRDLRHEPDPAARRQRQGGRTHHLLDQLLRRASQRKGG
jgi:hypothetical protein